MVRKEEERKESSSLQLSIPLRLGHIGSAASLTSLLPFLLSGHTLGPSVAFKMASENGFPRAFELVHSSISTWPFKQRPSQVQTKKRRRPSLASSETIVASLRRSRQLAIGSLPPS